MRRRFIMGLAATVVAACTAFGMTACNGGSGTAEDKKFRDVYNTYVVYAEEQGETPLSYEAWLASIKGERGERGETGAAGKDGANGKDGQNGADGIGIADVKIENGILYIKYTNSNKFIEIGRVKGENGAVGIADMKVENGKLYVKYTGSTEYIELGQVAGKDGIDGEDGANGKSAYEIYKEKYGYKGTEEEWIYDLVNGKLASIDKHTVAFDSDGGSPVEKQEIIDGKKAHEPDVPTKTGYTFCGWFVKSTEWNFLAYTVTEDVTLKARWVANKYTLKFDSVGGNAVADMVVSYEESYTLPVPVRENYVFLGWKDGEKLCPQTGKWQALDGAALTAEWVIAKSTITFDSIGGSSVSPMTIDYNTDYSLPESKKENHSFIGWFLGETKFESGTLLTGDITLVARWESVTDSFTFIESSDGITITAFKGVVTDVIVPAKINDIPVIAVADGVFKGNTKITSVSFDGSFENYSAKMFEGCTSLKRLIISGTYDKALYYLFGNDVNSVPKSLTELSFAANSAYCDGAIFKTEVANHIVTYVIPDGTTEIINGQFSGFGYLQAVSIPDSVTSIGNYAFSRSNSLTSINIPDGVTSIGDYAFGSCNSLTSIIIPGSVTSIGIYAFEYCSSLTSINILDGVTSIGQHAFRECRSLTSINIPDSVTSIGSSAFESCNGVIVKEKGICYVDKWVVDTVNGSITVAEIKADTKRIADNAFGNCISLSSIIIPDSVTSIGDSAFSGCSSLTSVTIGNSVASIGKYAFRNCSNLKTINYKGSKEQWDSISKGYSWNGDTDDYTINYNYKED